MIRNGIFEVIEPERRHLRQHFSLIGNRRRQDHIECRQAIRRDDQKMLAEIVNVADLAAPMKFHTGEISLRYDHVVRFSNEFSRRGLPSSV